MNGLLPFAAVAAIVFVVATRWRTLEKRPSLQFPAGLWLAIAVGISLYVLNRFGSKNDAQPSVLYFLLASAVGWLASCFDDTDLEANATVAIGAAAAITFIKPVHDQLAVGITAAVGAGLAAMALRSRTATFFAVALGGIVVANDIASFGSIESQVPHLASTLAAYLTLATVVWSLVPKLNEAAGRFILAAVLGILGVVTLHSADDAGALNICVALAAVVAWLTPLVIDDKNNVALRRTIMAIAWVGVASIAFSSSKSSGIAIAVIIGTLYAVAISSDAFLACIAPAIGIVIVRLFREMYPDTSRSLDLGQHYAIIGVAVGLVLPYLSATAKAKAKSYGSVAFATMMLLVPAIALIMMGAKGAYGLIVGLSLSALMPAHLTTIAAALAGMTVGMASLVQYAWLTEWFSEARIARLKGAGYWIATAVVLLAIWLFDNREAKSKEEAK